jgi:hypothetical protein
MGRLQQALQNAEIGMAILIELSRIGFGSTL